MKCLSRADIETIAGRVLKAYYQLPQNKGTDIFRIDPEQLITELLGLKVEYAHLSYDRHILGATTTVPMDIDIYMGDDAEQHYRLDGYTILIESDLRDDCTQLGRCNFSLAHECSHQILKMLYPHDYDANPKTQKVYYYQVNSEKRRPIADWYEWQANALASAILLPRDLICHGMYMFSLGEKIKTLNKVFYPKEYEHFSDMASFLGVSKTALAIRMKQLGLLENNHLDDPYCIVYIDYDGGN